MAGTGLTGPAAFLLLTATSRPVRDKYALQAKNEQTNEQTDKQKDIANAQNPRSCGKTLFCTTDNHKLDRRVRYTKRSWSMTKILQISRALAIKCGGVAFLGNPVMPRTLELSDTMLRADQPCHLCIDNDNEMVLLQCRMTACFHRFGLYFSVFCIFTVGWPHHSSFSIRNGMAIPDGDLLTNAGVVWKKSRFSTNISFCLGNDTR